MIIELDNIVIGEMMCGTINENTAEIGIKICDFSKQNKGYGKILLSMLIFSLFNDMGYNKIILDTNVKKIFKNNIVIRLSGLHIYLYILF